MARLQAAPLPPRDTEIIVVQSQGMRQWLTLAMADALGCAGSMALPFPARFVHSLAATLGMAGSDVDLFSREAMTWRLDALLRDVDLRDPRYASLSRYLSDGDDRMRFGFAARVAARFDDYQLFRHDLLEAWERGERVLDTPHEIWQAALWRELCAAGGEHGARRLTRLLAHLHAAEPGSLSLPSRVNVFGVSSLPPRIIELLAAIARHTEVTVYAALLPEHAVSAAAHPLATAFGRQGQVLQRLLVAQGATIVALPDPSARGADSLVVRWRRTPMAQARSRCPPTIHRCVFMRPTASCANSRLSAMRSGRRSWPIARSRRTTCCCWCPISVNGRRSCSRCSAPTTAR